LLATSENGGKKAFEIIVTNKIDSNKIDYLRNAGIETVPILAHAKLRQKSTKDYDDYLHALLDYKASIPITIIAKKLSKDRATIFGWVRGGTCPATLDRSKMRRMRAEVIGY
jgi:hypothetical protein